LVPVRFDPTAAGAPPTAEGALRRVPPPTRRWPTGVSQPELEELLRAELARALGHAGPAGFAHDTPFDHLGFDSLTVIEVRSRLTALTGLDLPVTVLFDRPTVTGLAEYLHARMSGRG
jgi:hypothetical protein